MKKSKGFTLAELLIVVAIIAVLVAVSIPVFTTQLAKAELATDTANVRSEYAAAVTEALANGSMEDGKMQVNFNSSGIATKCSVELSGSYIVVTHSAKSSLKNSFEVDENITFVTGSD